MKKNGYDWKACNRHKRFPSSNLGHSAHIRLAIFSSNHFIEPKVASFLVCIFDS